MEIPPLKFLLGTGIVFGALLYLAQSVRCRKQLDMAHFIEIMFAGGLLAGAVHLGMSAFHPEHLVHVTDHNGRPIDHTQYHFGLSDLHFIEVTRRRTDSRRFERSPFAVEPRPAEHIRQRFATSRQVRVGTMLA